MIKNYAFGIAALLLAAQVSAQPAFTDGTALLAHPANSGGCMAITDMDGDGLDDVIQLDFSKHVYVLYQEQDGTFTTVDYGTVSGSSQWGWAIADLNNDGHKDICSGGNSDGTHLVSITARGVYTLSTLNGPNIFMQNMSIGDVNNATSPTSDMSGNYGSCFTDFNNDGHLDLYIAHCRQGVNNPDDPRRWNRLFVNDGNNQYADLAEQYGADDHEQTWTSDFGDFNNDGYLDMVSTEHSTGTKLFLNDGTGHFTDVTTGSGLGVASFPLQGQRWLLGHHHRRWQ